MRMNVYILEEKEFLDLFSEELTCSQCDNSPRTLYCTAARSPVNITITFSFNFVIFYFHL